MAKRRRLHREDYTIGWVCALPVELAAAQEMLDEEHEEFDHDVNDTNIYTLGRIGEHNVVIACLPEGQIGASSAATVAVQMKSAFTSVRFGLMVGIGGGVPSAEADIRLGDVVVSRPYNVHAGVVQYDFGKATPDQFERTGSLNTPPTILLNAVAKLRANHIRGKGRLSEYISKLDALPTFTRENAGPDVLFDRDYKHVGGAACEQCSKERVVNRQQRSQDIVVHYGTIASGNEVMRDGAVRDKVSLELGGVLCFEMEAAGLMNSFPCLVIRGICDYADSHKNKRWQAYAAGTAAAYAKDVLSVIPAAEVVKPCTAQEIISENIASRRACWSVPFQRNSRFVGHDSEISQIEAILSSEDRCESVAIVGLGGIGKTQIALKFAYELRDKCPDCSVFWVPATNTDSMQEAYMEIGRQLRIPNVDKEQGNIQKLVQDHLSQESAGQWLLVFDNADDIDMWIDKGANLTNPRGLIDRLPKSRYGSIIFTTRSKSIAVKLAISNVIKVDKMDESAAKQLLSSSIIDQSLLDDGQSALDLLEWLTFLPLAIKQAAAYINENAISLSEYLGLLQIKEQDIIEVLSEDFEDEGRYSGAKNPIATTWLVSFEQIRHQNSLAAEYLSFMSCVEPKDIPQSLLPAIQSTNKSIKAIGTLVAYSFVTKRATDRSLDLHRLVHLATRNWLRMEKSLEDWTSKAVIRLNEVFPDDDDKNRSTWRRYLPHARYILEYGFVKDSLKEREELLWKYGMCLYSDGRYVEAERSITQVIKTQKQVLGAEHPDTLRSMNILTSTYGFQGRWKEAEGLGVRVMETRTRILGAEHPDTLASMYWLAMTYSRQGRWKEAEKLQTKDLEISKRVLGVKHLDTVARMHSLASTYMDQGRWKEAEKLQVEVVETYKGVLYVGHPYTLTGMANLASTYIYQGRWKEAEELGVEVLETRKRVLGAEHPETLTSMANLGSTFGNQGRWKEAEVLDVEVLEIRKRVLGAEHPDTLTSMDNLASTYRDQRRWKEAEVLGVEVLETRKRVLGAEHPSTLTSMNNLAFTWKGQGRNKEAIALMKECAQLEERVLGPNHPFTSSSRGGLNRWERESSELDFSNI